MQAMPRRNFGIVWWSSDGKRKEERGKMPEFESDQIIIHSGDRK
jgi:hypothetical protein